MSESAGKPGPWAAWRVVGTGHESRLELEDELTKFRLDATTTDEILQASSTPCTRGMEGHAGGRLFTF